MNSKFNKANFPVAQRFKLIVIAHWDKSVAILRCPQMFQGRQTLKGNKPGNKGYSTQSNLIGLRKGS